MANRSYSISEVCGWKFDLATLPKPWNDFLGEIPKRITIYVDGEGGDGKTEFAIQMMKVFAIHLGKSRMINVELMKHKQVTDSFIRNQIKEDVKAGQIQYDVITEFEGIKAKLKRPNSGRYIFIDSISFFPLDEKQIQELFALFPHKSFIILAYRAHFNKNKPIRHLCDIKINVQDHIARIEGGRFGGYKEFDVWPAKPTRKKSYSEIQKSLFESEVNHG